MATLRSNLISLYLGDGLRDVARRVHRARRAGRRGLTYVHRVDDPHGLAMLSVLPGLVVAADFELRILVIPAPESEFAPDAPRLRIWALADAERQARTHGFPFPADPRIPTPERVDSALASALIERPWREWIRVLRAIGEALFGSETAEGEGAVPMPEPTPMLPGAARARANANVSEVHRLGHYQGSMLLYEGEWYWGLDRLPFLEDRLRGEGLRLAAMLDDTARPEVPVSDASELEFFFSFRSPYSYLALDRTVRVVAQRGLTLRVRPVLPMVMRGLSVPWAKRRYIVRDCHRLAARLGVPFGRIADPVGRGVERCMAIVPVAQAQDRVTDWLQSATAGIWSEGVDVDSESGLRRVIERAGLDVRASMAAAESADETAGAQWRIDAEENRRALLDMGLWGVPSFRLGELVVWGQDRIDVLEAALRER